jgi:hypothetical protein
LWTGIQEAYSPFTLCLTTFCPPATIWSLMIFSAADKCPPTVVCARGGLATFVVPVSNTIERSNAAIEIMILGFSGIQWKQG